MVVQRNPTEAEMLYLRMICSVFSVLASAIWRRTPDSRIKILAWLGEYMLTAVIFIGLLVAMPRRTGLFLFYYAWFRPLDDMLDGDDTNPPKDLDHLLLKKSALLRKYCRGELQRKDVSGEDRLLLLMQKLGGSLGILEGLKKYTPLIWRTMVTDYLWRQYKVIPHQRQLETLAQEQDQGIFRVAALIFGASEEVLEREITFDRSGVFTWTDWLEDVDQDLKRGIVHFPSSLKEARWEWESVEMQRLHALWQDVEKEKGRLLASFPNRFLAWFYDFYLIGDMRRRYDTLRRENCFAW